MTGASWYVVNAHPAQEYRVRDRLGKQGWEVWLPECEVRRTTRSCVRITLKGPLFPTYLFVALDLAAGPWRAVEEVTGVNRILGRTGHDGEPVPVAVPRTAIDSLRQRAAADGGRIVIETDGRLRRFAKGQQIRVEGGVWLGWEGVYLAEDKDRIKILLDMFGRAVTADVPEALVVAA